MPVPRHFFIDTNIFEAEKFNFGNDRFVAFEKHFATDVLVLLMPDVIEREIREHIAGFAGRARAALKKLRSDAPMIVQADNVPVSRQSVDELLRGWKQRSSKTLKTSWPATGLFISDTRKSTFRA